MKTPRPKLLWVGIMLVLGMVSCTPDILIGDFDASDLVGTWREGTVYEKYLDDGTGYTWDTADDVTEEEAQPFEWSLDGDQLIQEHIMFGSEVVPRILTITKLNSFQLVYTDTGGVSHTFTREL